MIKNVFIVLLVEILLLSFNSLASISSSCRHNFSPTNGVTSKVSVFVKEAATGDQHQVLHQKTSNISLVNVLPVNRSLPNREKLKTLQDQQTIRELSTSRSLSASRGLRSANARERGTRALSRSDNLKEILQLHGLSISEAVTADKIELVNFLKKIREEFGIKSEGANASEVLDADLVDITGNYTNNRGRLLIFRRGNMIVGTAGLFQLTASTAELRKIYLDPSIRGLKLGQAIVTRFLELAKELSYSTVELETYESMKGAIALYTKNGFERFFPERIVHEPDVHAYRLELSKLAHLLEETPTQKLYRAQFESWKNPFLENVYLNKEAKGRFSYKVFKKFLTQEAEKKSDVYEVYKELGIRFETKAKGSYLNLGVEFSGGDIIIPSQAKMIENFIKALENRNIPKEDWILPAITYKRSRVEGVVEYRMIVPTVEAFPLETGFTLIDRLPDSVFQYGLRNAMMPFSNFHDIHHMVVFLLHPWQTMVPARRALRNIESDNLSLGQRRRLSYAFESLSLVREQNKVDLQNILEVSKWPKNMSEEAAIRTYINELKSMDLKRLALKIVEVFDGLIIDLSAIGVSSTEKNLELIDYKAKGTAYRVNEMIKSFQKPEVFKGSDLPRNSFLEDPMYMSTRLNMLIEAYEKNREVDRVLRFHLIRMINFLHKGNISGDVWINEMMSKDFRNSESMDFMRRAFGENSITYRMLNVD